MQAVILIEQGFQDEEFIYPYYRMMEEGWEVTCESINGGDVFGKYGVPVRGTVKLSYFPADIIYIPGGWQSPEKLRMNEQVLGFVRSMNRSSMLIAAICHGPQVLISAGIVKGRTVTGYLGIKDDLVNAGAVYPVEPVIVDGNLITAQHYRDNPAFMREVVDYMRKLQQPEAYARASHAI